MMQSSQKGKTLGRLMELQDWHVDGKVRERESWDAGTGEDSCTMLCCVFIINWPILLPFLSVFAIGLNMHFACKPCQRKNTRNVTFLVSYLSSQKRHRFFLITLDACKRYAAFLKSLA